MEIPSVHMEIDRREQALLTTFRTDPDILWRGATKFAGGQLVEKDLDHSGFQLALQLGRDEYIVHLELFANVLPLETFQKASAEVPDQVDYSIVAIPCPRYRLPDALAHYP